ncbi:MAG TPA: bile acid:sodium symporter [Xanthobacteraceae bacterium]|nr:bile acid:sodium symporter [Xanthobacteraceae bacterium]
MSLDRLINILVTITLIEMMVLIGLRVTFAEIVATVRDWRLVARAAAANYLFVPLVAIALLIGFDVSPAVAAGFLILAVCPGAPFGPPFAGIARANVPVAVGLMVVLAGSSAILSPLLLRLLLPWVSGGEVPSVDLIGMVGALLLTQLLPLLLGLVVRHWRPRLAERLLSPFELVSKIMSLSVAGLILATQFRMLSEIRIRGFVGMLVLLAATLAIGWLAGGPGRDRRKTMALTTALRNVGVGLVIVTGNFAGTPAVSAALAYGIVEVAGALLLALWWGRRETMPGLSGRPTTTSRN